MVFSRIAMAQVSKLDAIQNFYRRWSPRVFGFCSLVLGEGSSAEAATAGAFRAYVERDLELDVVRMPEELLAFAWGLSKQCPNGGENARASGQTLRDAILLLPLEERAVFVLRSILAVDELDAGSILGLPLPALRRTWFHAVRHLTKLLPANFHKERSA